MAKRAATNSKDFLKKHEHRLKNHSITLEDLKQKCIPSHVVKIARDLSEWRTTRAYLGITEDEMKKIEANNKGDEAAMRLCLLETWLKAQGDEATYLTLLEALDSSNRVDLIDECLKLLEEEKNSKRQDEGVDSDSSDTLKDEDMKFLCGCGQCSLSSFLEKGCPNPWKHAHFPLLNIKKMKRREKLELLSRLKKDADEITEKFGSFTRKVYRSLKKLKDFDVHELVLFLLPQQKFSYMSEEKRIKLQSDLSEAPDVGKVMTLLTKGYISWFNHPLLGSITKEFKVCETEYQEYVDNELTPFLQRSLFEIPSNSFNDISGDPQGSGEFILKIDIPNPKDSFEANILLPLRDHVSSTLGIAIDAFEFCSYGKGCIQFVIAAPLVLLLKIFPLSDRVLQLLSTFSYKNLSMKSIQFKIMQAIPKNEAINEECFLSSKLTDVFTMFASVIVELYKCIKENNIKLQRVKEFLLHLNSQRLTVSDDKPLLHNVVTQVKKISTLADLLLFLNQFWSFYNFNLLERLFRKFDANKAEGKLREYILSLEALRVMEMPPLIQPFFNADSYHFDLLELRLVPNSLQALPVEELLPIHFRVATVLGIEIYALLLKEIKVSEDKLEYLVPVCVQFDPDMMASLPWSSLREDKIVGISFKDFNSDCTLQQLTYKALKNDSEDSGLDTESVGSFESENEDHQEQKHTGGGKKRRSQKFKSKGSRFLDSPPSSQSSTSAQHHHVSYDTQLSPPYPYSASSFSRYDTNLYPSFACISPSYANASSFLPYGNVNLSSPLFNPYLTYQDKAQPIKTDILLSNTSMESPANMNVHSGDQGSVTFPPQVYEIILNSETMPQFMSQNLLSQANPRFMNQAGQDSFDVKYQNKLLPPTPPGVAKPQNLLSPPGISQTLSSHQWAIPPTSTVTTDKQETLSKLQDEWPSITEFNVKCQAFSLNEQKVIKQAEHSSSKNELSLQKGVKQPPPIIQKKLAQQKMDYKGREIWKTNFIERLKYTELSEENVSVELTSSNYRDKFYYLLCFEESEHICLLSEKCDGEYKLFLKGYEMVEGRHYYVGYIYGMSHDQMQYATQASEAMFIIDREKNEDICRAEIIPANFGNVNNKFLIALPSSSIEHFMRTFGINEGESCQVSVQFEVKHSYFDTLHKAVINIPQTMINKLFPSKEDLCKPLETGVRRINSNCQVKALSIDEFGQLKALEVILQSPPNLPIIISGPFGSGKTRVLARATYEFVKDGLHQQQCTRILICAHHYNTVETYVSNYLGPAFQGRRGIKIIKLMRNDSFGLASNIIHRSVRGFREDVRHGHYVSDHVLVIVTTYTTSLHVADAIGSYKFHFTHILLDEVAQVREPEAIGALCLGTPQTKVVIAGDSKQVGPSVVVLGDLSRDNGLKVSLLERLEKRYDEIGPKALCYLIQLDINYRCHPVITTLLSNVIYKYPIQSGLSPSKQHPKAKNCPYIFYCSDVTNDPTLDSEHFMKIEANAVINQLNLFFSIGKWPKSWKEFALNDVCVMSSFRTQLNIIRKRLKDSTFRDVTLLPSYAIQGHEFQAVVLSTYEPLKDTGESSNPTKTLVNPQVFNTAISRSRQLVIAVGNPFRLLNTEKIMGYHAEGCWREYIKLCLEKNTMFFSRNSRLDLETLKKLLKAEVGISSTVKTFSSPPQRSQTDDTLQAAKRPSLKTSWSYPSTERLSSLSGHGKKTEVQSGHVHEKESTSSLKPKKSVTSIPNPPGIITSTQFKASGQTSKQPVSNKSVCVHEKESTSSPKLKKSVTPIPKPPIQLKAPGQTSSKQPVSSKSVCAHEESTTAPKLKKSITSIPNPPGITSIEHGQTSDQSVSKKSATWSYSGQRVSHKSEILSSSYTLSSKSESFQQSVSNKQSLQKSTQSTKSATLGPHPSDTISVQQTSSGQPVFSTSVSCVTGKSGSMSSFQQPFSRTLSPSRKLTQRPQSKMSAPPFSSAQILTFADVVSARSTQYDSLQLRQLEGEQPIHKYMKPKDEIEIFAGSSKSKRKKKQKNSQSKHTFTLESISDVLQPPGYSMFTSDKSPVKESPKEVRTFADVVKQPAPKKSATK